MKQPIYKCLAEYTTFELIQFHANLNSLFIGCTEDFHVLPLLMQVHFALSSRNSVDGDKYLASMADL